MLLHTTEKQKAPTKQQTFCVNPSFFPTNQTDPTLGWSPGSAPELSLWTLAFLIPFPTVYHSSIKIGVSNLIRGSRKFQNFLGSRIIIIQQNKVAQCSSKICLKTSFQIGKK